MTALLSAMAYILAFVEFPVPLFENFMPLEQPISSFSEFLPFIHTKLDAVLFNVFPFNLLKGLAIGGVTMPTYKRLTPALKGSRRNHRGGLYHEEK